MGILDKLFGEPSVARFAAQMIQALRRAGETADMRFDASEHRIVVEGASGPSNTLNLANIYQTYLQQPRSKRAACVRSMAISLLSTRKPLPADFDLVRADLRPKLWSRDSFEQIRLEGLIAGRDGEPIDMPSTAIGDHLLVVFVYDWPNSVQTVTDANLKDWGVTFYEAMEAASANLEEATTAYAELGKGTYAFASADTYDATRIILQDRIRGLEVNGKHVALVPNRDSIIITGSDDEVGLQVMAGLGTKALERPYPITESP